MDSRSALGLTVNKVRIVGARDRLASGVRSAKKTFEITYLLN